MHCVSCAMLSGVSRVTLHRFFTCAMLSQDYYDNIEQNFFMYNVVWSLLDNIVEGFTSEMLSQECQDNIEQDFFSMQCCLDSLRQHWTKLLMKMMINCSCGMVDRRKALSLISSRGHCQRSSPSRISDAPRAGFEPAQNLSWGLVEWSCAVVRTTTPRRHKAWNNVLPVQCWPIANRQLLWGKYPTQWCIDHIGTTLYRNIA